MDGAEFGSKLRAAMDFFDDVGLIRTVSSIHSLPVREEFNAVALAPESSYKEIYLCAVSNSYYNIMLQDFSILQFSWTSDEAWRLAYLPNPWISGVEGAIEKVAEWEILEELGRYDQEEVALLIGDLPYYGSIPPIRFEFSVAQYRELSHPSAHFHIGRHTENRWPLSKKLNPLTFSMIIVKMYYVNNWAPYSFYYTGAEAGCLDARLVEQLERSGLVREFTEIERRSFHFTAR